MPSKIAPPNSKLRTHKLSVALQTDPRTWKGGFALHIHRSTWIFRLALNLPNSRLLAPGPSHCWVQLGSGTDPHGAVQCTQHLNHPLRLIQATSLDHSVRLGTKMLYFRVYGGLGSAQLSGLEYTLATSLADAGIISVSLLLITTCSKKEARFIRVQLYIFYLHFFQVSFPLISSRTWLSEPT